MVLAVPVLLTNIYQLQAYTQGPMSIILKPFIIKHDIIAFNQVFQILLETFAQITQVWYPHYDDGRYIRALQQTLALLQVLFLSVAITLRK